MARPTEFPDWATNPADEEASVVAPLASLVEEGWTPSEKPPAQIFNWWKRLVGLWVRHVDETLEGMPAATLLRNGPAELEPPFDTTTVPAPRKCLWRVRAGTAGGVPYFARLYVHSSGTFELFINAHRTAGGAWLCDTSNIAMYRIEGLGRWFKRSTLPGASGTGAGAADAAWTAATVLASFDPAELINTVGAATPVDRIFVGIADDGRAGWAEHLNRPIQLVDGLSGRPALNAGWTTVSIGGISTRPSYYVDITGRCWLGGAANNVAGSSTVFTLPALPYHRPRRQKIYRVSGTAAGGYDLAIYETGVVEVISAGAPGYYVDLSGVSFHADEQ